MQFGNMKNCMDENIVTLCDVDNRRMESRLDY